MIMEKIKKRIMKAIEQLQLADNEMDRLSIMGKAAKLEDDAISMIAELGKLVEKMLATKESTKTE